MTTEAWGQAYYLCPGDSGASPGEAYPNDFRGRFGQDLGLLQAAVESLPAMRSNSDPGPTRMSRQEALTRLETNYPKLVEGFIRRCSSTQQGAQWRTYINERIEALETELGVTSRTDVARLNDPQAQATLLGLISQANGRVGTWRTYVDGQIGALESRLQVTPQPNARSRSDEQARTRLDELVGQANPASIGDNWRRFVDQQITALATELGDDGTMPNTLSDDEAMARLVRLRESIRTTGEIDAANLAWRTAIEEHISRLEVQLEIQQTPLVDLARMSDEAARTELSRLITLANPAPTPPDPPKKDSFGWGEVGMGIGIAGAAAAYAAWYFWPDTGIAQQVKPHLYIDSRGYQEYGFRWQSPKERHGVSFTAGEETAQVRYELRW